MIPPIVIYLRSTSSSLDDISAPAIFSARRSLLLCRILRSTIPPVVFFARSLPPIFSTRISRLPSSTDTGIASEKDWGISLLDEKVSESGTNEDGSTWYRESGEELGDNGYRCRWAEIGGKSPDGSSEWKETVQRSLGKMLKEIHGGRHGKKFFIRMNGGVRLADRYPSLYRWANNPDCFISDARVLKSSNVCVGWDISFYALVNGVNLLSLAQDLERIQNSNGEDVVRWRWTRDGNFSTKSLYLLLTFCGIRDRFYRFLWNCNLPPKISIFGWIRLRKRLLTRDRLAQWGITLDTSCLLCDGWKRMSTCSLLALTVVLGIAVVVGALSRNLADLQEREESYLSIYDHPSIALVAQDPVISLIHASVDKLTRSTNVLQYLGQHALIVQADAPTSEEADQVADENYHFMSLLLNLASTYLYMVNTYIIVPTADDYSVQLLIYFMLKYAMEILLSESSVITSYYFGWSTSSVVIFLAILGLTVLLVNAIVGIYISNMFEDRQILLGFEILVLAGILLSFKFTSSYMVPQYVCSALITFVAAEVLEVMSSRLARGTYNGGLLSTEAGTLARVAADGTITLAGYLGESKLLNVTLFPSLLNCISSIPATCLTYNSLF
ncbi:hypothetical protein Cni_G29458 [Canna indica]|uniref:Reverse transcriptase zinc-binding domain-containing protein n=1 Tax=Canna indica TaxID=4628 RepID=A0AAQ3QTN4_9LILI|nr:hypothetical protein Cni_G29458 [Canna indica]